MTRLRLSRAEFAHDARVSTRTVSRWCQGDLLPHENSHDDLLRALAPAGAGVIADVRSALGLGPAPPALAPPRDLPRLRAEVELAVYAAAERFALAPSTARAALGDMLASLERIGATIPEARAWIAEAEKQRGAPGTSD
jgi:hypothetical protein